MWGVLALVAVCHPSQEGWRQGFHRERASLAPSDTVCQQEQGRGRKLVTEEPKPVGSGRFRVPSQDSSWVLGTSCSSSFSLRQEPGLGPSASRNKLTALTRQSDPPLSPAHHSLCPPVPHRAA